MKFEAVITVWEDNQFVMRDRIEANNSNSLREQVEIIMGMIENKLEERKQKKYAVGEDDDIPF